MRKSIVAFVLTLFVFTFTNLQTSHAEDKDLIVGKWEMNTTMNDYMERGILTFRENGTGVLDRYALGEESVHLSFTWKIERNAVRFIYSSTEIKQVLYRFEDTNSLMLTPANASLQPIGPQLEYYRQFGKLSPPKAMSKKQVVGVWEAVVSSNVKSCHNVIVLRTYGTGESTTLCGSEREYEEFHWELIDGNIVKFRPNGTNAKGRVRMINKTNFTITAIDYYGAVMSPEIYYTKIFDNYEGC